MTSRVHLLTLIACATISTGSYAQRCEGNVYKAAVTLAALPVEVRTAMLRDSRLADRGEAFQATDLVLERNPPPFRRFSIAAINQRRIVVAIQVGGGPNYDWYASTACSMIDLDLRAWMTGAKSEAAMATARMERKGRVIRSIVSGCDAHRMSQPVASQALVCNASVQPINQGVVPLRAP